jgi:quercetin dioxygenase-like cupin family protein
MTTLKYDQLRVQQIGQKVERRLAHTDNLMIVIVDFYDGPTPEPDPPHAHPHEQVSYVAEGELLFIIDGEPTHLGPGDVALIPSGVSHTIHRLTEHVRLVDSFTPLREDFLA